MLSLIPKIIHRRALSVSIALLVFITSGLAQDKQVLTGKITTPDGKDVIPGVTIVVKGTAEGTISDANGNFRLTAAPDATLIVSFLGYETVEVPVSSRTQVEVALVADVHQLDEVVVVGYGSQERKNLISSVSVVDAAEVKNIPVASVDAQLQGKAAGVQINSNAGIPGDGIFVRVRGTTSINASNDPLYVVDGVFINNTSLQTISTGGRATSPVADINPADIENIEVLKDASATAIYGSRGANGVVIITTKRGNYNAPAKVTFNTSQGVAWAPQLWKLTTGEQHAELVNEFYTNSEADAITAADKAKYATLPFRPVADGGRGLPSDQKTYDRLHEVFRTANLSNYDLSLSGGNNSTKYYLGGGYTRQQAIVKPVDFNRASFKLNLDQKINDRFQVGVTNSLSRTYRNQVRAGDGPAGGLLQSALHTPTYLPEVNADGTPARWAGFDNLNVLIHNYHVNSTSLRYIGNIYAEAKILPQLIFRTSWSTDYDHYEESEYWNNQTQLGSAPTNGLATSTLTQNSSWINEQTLSYETLLAGKHAISVLAGNTLSSKITKVTGATGTGFPNNTFTDISSAATRTAAQTYTKANLGSYFSRFTYHFKSSYFLEASVRADGSSKFGKNNRWGYFPSVGGAWRIKDERFLRDVNFVSDLKLRASLGITGNQNGIADFAAQGLWAGGAGYPDNVSGGDLAGISPSQIANQNLKWERTRQINLGIDASVLEGRIALELNFYSKYTTNLLISKPVPAISGFSTYFSNDGEMSNKGVELSVTSHNIRSGGFVWQTNFNISRNINKIEKLAVPITTYNRDWVRMQQGSSMYSFWLYKQQYVDPENGKAVFQDVNGDGAITVADRRILGNASPKFFGGITNTFSYRGFDLNILFSYQYGNKVYNLNRFFGEGGGTRDANRVLFASQLQRWQKPGDITETPRLTAIGNNYTLDQNSRFLEDGSFLRLRSATLGYTLPKQLLSHVHLQGVRLYVIGTNLLLFKKYSGPDPELNVTASQQVQGLDLGTPPQPRTIQAGITVTL